MASKFEREIQFLISDIEIFKNKLDELGAELLYPYEFNDHYFRPVNDKWNPLEKILRIREWTTPNYPTKIFFVKNEIIEIGRMQFKRSLYPEGKVPLYEGSIETSTKLLNDLGFNLWFVLKKQKANHWKVAKHDFETVAEYIDGLGWSGELEFKGDDPKKAKEEIEKSLKILGIPVERASFKPISVLYAEQHNLLEK